tara:strand:- start:132 stop:746 length:615 start_codon:yes stop_codon:yes gene_type:complete
MSGIIFKGISSNTPKKGTHNIPPNNSAKNPQKHKVTGGIDSFIEYILKSFPVRQSTLSTARSVSESNLSVPGFIISITPNNPHKIISQTKNLTFFSKKKILPNAINIGIVCIIAVVIAREPKTMLITKNIEANNSQINRVKKGGLIKSEWNKVLFVKRAITKKTDVPNDPIIIKIWDIGINSPKYLLIMSRMVKQAIAKIIKTI